MRNGDLCSELRGYLAILFLLVQIPLLVRQRIVASATESVILSGIEGSRDETIYLCYGILPRKLRGLRSAQDDRRFPTVSKIE